jgi:hypothetical protein
VTAARTVCPGGWPEETAAPSGARPSGMSPVPLRVVSGVTDGVTR